METNKKQTIDIETVVNRDSHTVWECWTNPDHITKWNNASADWHTPIAENDLRIGGKFRSRMEAKDGSNGFDFSGIYTKVDKGKEIEYILDDDRKVHIGFETKGDKTIIKETFEAEDINSIELQRNGWQSILNNFKHYVESIQK